MNTTQCVNCQEEVDKSNQAKVVWKEHEGYLLLELSKEPDSLNQQRKAHICKKCSLVILNGLVQMENESM